jgi:hypothetical protein
MTHLACLTILTFLPREFFEVKGDRLMETRRNHLGRVITKIDNLTYLPK